MTDDLRTLRAQLRRNPASLAFLELAEALRRRGRLDEALDVARVGLDRHPDRDEARDLCARILADQGNVVQARIVWAALRDRNPRHIGALKGLAYIAFRAGDLDEALELLENALAVDPTDDSVVRALQTVRQAVEELEADTFERAADRIMSGLGGLEQGVLLVDARGRVLGGRIEGTERRNVTDVVAAHLAGAAQEADRTARLLGLGGWTWAVAEGEAGNTYLTPPTDDTLLLIVRDTTVPPGRLALLARDAGDAARAWLAEQQL
jgi:tetratricopeptide (TPR) repeat protein